MIKRWILIGAMGLIGIGMLLVGFPSTSLAQEDLTLQSSEAAWFPLEAAVREVQRIEPAYRAAQAEVKEAARQIKSFLPVTLEASEPIKQNPTDRVAVLGMKKIPMKENVSGLRFELGTFNGDSAKLESVFSSKPLFKVLRL